MTRWASRDATSILRRAAVFPAIVGVLAALAGCGGSGSPGPPQATLVLDFQPNAVHAGTFLTTRRGYDAAAGVRLRVQAPSSSTDALKLLRTGRARFAFVDIHDLAIAGATPRGGRDVVGVMALVERPLAAVLASPRVARPRELAGRRAGVSGLPSDEAVLRSIVSGDGGDAAAVKRVQIGFQAVPALLAGRVDGATGFWNAEGVALRRRRPATHVFRVDDYGAPSYPELVLATTRATLRGDAALVRSTVRALRRGYEAALRDPPAALAALRSGAPAIDAGAAAQELRALTPALAPRGGRFGELVPATLARWASWELRFGIVTRAPRVASLFDPAIANAR